MNETHIPITDLTPSKAPNFEYLKTLEISVLAQKVAAKAYLLTFFAAPKFRQEAVSGAQAPKIVNCFGLLTCLAFF